MIKQLHQKNISSRAQAPKQRIHPQMTSKQMLKAVREDLLQPRDQAVLNILAKALSDKMV